MKSTEKFDNLIKTLDKCIENRSKSNKSTFDCFDLNNKFLGNFKTVAAASRELGFSVSSGYKVLQGIYTNANGVYIKEV